MTIAGLILDIAGVALLWYFAFPQPSFEEGGGIGLEDASLLEDGRTVAEHYEATRRKRALYRKMSQVALGLIVAGHPGDTVETVSLTYVHRLRDDREVPAGAGSGAGSNC